MTWTLRLVLIVASVLLAISASEVGLRLFRAPKPSISGWKTMDFDSLQTNQLGFRGQPITYSDADFVIALVGDSQVEAKACSYEWMPERRLEFYLNSLGRRVRVFSVGASAYGQDQELLSLREYYQKNFRADLVILWETPLNDIWNNVFPTNWPADGFPKPTFWLDGQTLQGPSEGIMQPIHETPSLKLLALWRKTSHWSRDKYWEKYLPRPYVPLTTLNESVRSDWQEWFNENRRDLRNENFATEKTHWAMYLTPRSERTKYGLDLTRALIQEMQQLVGSHGGKFVTFAARNPPSYWREASDGVHVLNGKYYRTSLAQYVENLDYINHGFDFHLVPVTVAQWEYGPDNAHLNEHANDQVMRDLAARIASMVPLQR